MKRPQPQVARPGRCLTELSTVMLVIGGLMVSAVLWLLIWAVL